MTSGTICGDCAAQQQDETMTTNDAPGEPTQKKRATPGATHPRAQPILPPSATADSGHAPYGPSATPPGLSAAPGATSPCPTCLGTGIGVDLLPCLDC